MYGPKSTAEGPKPIRTFRAADPRLGCARTEWLDRRSQPLGLGAGERAEV
jgi:hypothetical protein